MSQLVVGRDAECAVLRRRLAFPRGGPGAIVLVAGEGGAGKTTLVEHVLAATTTPALCGRAAEWAPRAYDVLARALRPVIHSAGEPVPDLLAQIIPDPMSSLTNGSGVHVMTFQTENAAHGWLNDVIAIGEGGIDPDRAVLAMRYHACAVDYLPSIGAPTDQ